MREDFNDDMRIGGASSSLVPPGTTPCPQWGHLADKGTKLAKKKASAALRPPVVMEGESLDSIYSSTTSGAASHAT